MLRKGLANQEGCRSRLLCTNQLWLHASSISEQTKGRLGKKLNFDFRISGHKKL